jgi:hypothetical protein
MPTDLELSIRQPTYFKEIRCHVIEIPSTTYSFVWTGSKQAGFYPTPGGVDPLHDEFLARFLDLASPYFSRPLQLPLFKQRIQHIWSVPAEIEAELADAQATVRWIPASVHFYPTRYEFHWDIQSVERLQTPGPAPQVRTFRVEEAPPAPESPSPDLLYGAELLEATDALDSIPFLERTGRSLRSRERRKIRLARLRVALAQLRVERLVERYYQRYGDAVLEEGESDLSSGSEAEE